MDDEEIEEIKKEKEKKIKTIRKPRIRKNKPTILTTTLNEILKKEKDLQDKTDLEKANYNNQKLNIDIQEETTKDKATKLIIINKIIRECLKTATETYNTIKSEMFSSFIPAITSLTNEFQSYLFILENKQGFNSSTDKLEERLSNFINTIFDYNKNITHHHQISKYMDYYSKLDTATKNFNNSCLQARGLYNLFYVNHTPNHFNPELKNHNLWPSLSDIYSIWNFAPLTPMTSFSSFSLPLLLFKDDSPLHKDEIEFIHSLRNISSDLKLSREQLNRLVDIKDKCITNINNTLITINKLKNEVQSLSITFEHIYNEIFLKNVFEITIIKRFSVY